MVAATLTMVDTVQASANAATVFAGRTRKWMSPKAVCVPSDTPTSTLTRPVGDDPASRVSRPSGRTRAKASLLLRTCAETSVNASPSLSSNAATAFVVNVAPCSTSCCGTGPACCGGLFAESPTISIVTVAEEVCPLPSSMV